MATVSEPKLLQKHILNWSNLVSYLYTPKGPLNQLTSHKLVRWFVRFIILGNYLWTQAWPICSLDLFNLFLDALTLSSYSLVSTRILVTIGCYWNVCLYQNDYSATKIENFTFLLYNVPNFKTTNPCCIFSWFFFIFHKTQSKFTIAFYYPNLLGINNFFVKSHFLLELQFLI